MGLAEFYVAPVTSLGQGTEILKRAAMIESVVNQLAELSSCFLYIFRPQVVWLPVLNLSKAEDAYALREVTFGSRF